MIHQYNLDVYEKYMHYKMRAALLVYYAIQQVSQSQTNLDLLRFTADNDYQSLVKRYFSADNRNPFAVVVSEEESDMIQPTAKQSGEAEKPVDAPQS